MLTDKIRKLVARELEMSIENVPTDAGMDTFEQWDSISHINICLAIQSEFGIDMTTEEISDCTSLPKFVALLEIKGKVTPSGG